jgi:hypothetical protein
LLLPLLRAQLGAAADLVAPGAWERGAAHGFFDPATRGERWFGMLGVGSGTAAHGIRKVVGAGGWLAARSFVAVRALGQRQTGTGRVGPRRLSRAERSGVVGRRGQELGPVRCEPRSGRERRGPGPPRP